MRYWLLILPIFIGTSVCAQRHYLDSISRAQYIERFPDYFFVWPVFRQRASSFVLQNASNTNSNLTFSPNIRFQTGLGFYLFEIGFQFIVAIPRPASSIEEYGESNSFDIQASLVGKNWDVELFQEDYKGYYLEDSQVPIPSGVPKLQRRDIATSNRGISAIYFSNKQKYSVRAIYNFYERQLRSAGSPLVSLSFNQFTLNADSLVYNQYHQNTLDAQGGFDHMKYETVALAAGYGYNLVLHKNWFIGSNVAVGPVLQFFDYSKQSNQNSLVAVRPYINWRITGGLNSERFFAGVTYTYQSVEIDYENVHLSSRNGTFRLVIGYRFREVGILKKRASEFMKPKQR